MKIYSLRTTVDNPDAIVDFSGSADRIADYFIHNRGDGKFLQHSPLRAVAQSGYTPDALEGTDFVAASLRIPLFSSRFVEALAPMLKDEVQFHPCTVTSADREVEFHAAKILMFLDLLQSSQPRPSLGRPLLGAKYREEFDRAFLMARDTTSRARYVVSQPLRDAVEREGLRVGFAEPV